MLDRLRKNVEEVEQRITKACARAGRDRKSVQLVAVTKSVTADVAALLPGLGVSELAESRPQELWHKAGSITAPVRWHMIGHLQRNKLDRTLPLVSVVHSVDSLRLLQSIEAWAAGRTIDVLLEVNASGESTKQGFPVDQLDSLLPILPALRRVRVRGLMTMAAFSENIEESRPTFALLRRLRDKMQTALGPAVQLSDLSMGMSNDFEVAIEEGATLIRLGTVLFEGIVPD